MTYRVARGGEVYGPYSVLEMERHLGTGHVVGTDLAQADGMEEWLPVETLFPTAPGRGRVGAAGVPALFPDPPDLHWAVVLLLGIVTFNLFSVGWDLYEAVWMRRVDRGSVAVWLYGASAIAFVWKIPTTVQNILYNVGVGDAVNQSHPVLFALVSAGLAIAARMVFRAELLRHFNEREPLGLRLNWFLALLFGGIYFQYHFNRINELKRALRVSVPGA